ncbi:MAG: hypothetical protein ACREYB_01700 [Casimicrobiaceae bacterium]
MMVSAWWLVWVFLAGGYAGFLLLALLRMADESADTGHDAAMARRAVAWRHSSERRGFRSGVQ